MCIYIHTYIYKNWAGKKIQILRSNSSRENWPYSMGINLVFRRSESNKNITFHPSTGQF